MLGKIVCELKPNTGNARNSEGAFITLDNGNILFIYSRYEDNHNDNAAANLFGIISKDEGETFGKPFPVFTKDMMQDADNLMSVSLLRMCSGEIGLFYLKKNNSKHSCIPYFTHLSDKYRPIIDPIKCIDSDDYHVLNNDRILRLNNGRLLMPTARHINGGPGTIYISASDDNGRNWRILRSDIKLPVFVRNGHPLDSSAMEPGLVELDDGTIWCFIRTQLGRQYEMFSSDNGETWSEIQPSRFTSPESPMSVKKLSNGNLVAVWNPIPNFNEQNVCPKGAWTGGRNPLRLAILDGNANATLFTDLVEDDETRGFCYAAIHELNNGDLLLGYCAGGTEDKGCLNKLRIKKIKHEEFAK